MANQGILQAQLKVKNSMNLENGFIDNPLLKSVEGEINLTDENSFRGFVGNTAIEHLDTVKSSNQNAVDLTNSLNNLSNLKYAKLEGNFNSNVEGKFSGNTSMEKLDLSQDITIKPNDLAENESLRELPKLDFSNPDLTDIITNDTELKSTTIDLSNQNNTTKLGIRGDSTHIVSILDGIKVSTEAPFDSTTSPQLNVSYTSLDRQALVTLFNSMPYNVAYEKVGNPTVVNGIASNFSGTSYLQTSVSQTETTTSFEWNFKFNTGTLDTSYAQYVVSYSTHGGIYVTSAKQVRVTWINSNSDWVEKRTNYTVSDDTTYTVNVKVDNSTETGIVTIFSESGSVLFTETYTDVTCRRMNSLVWIGMRGDISYVTDYWRGTIDLNETYIKINGVLWFGPGATKNLVPSGTVVGSPTIIDGIASNFSGTSYLQPTEQYNTAPNTMEWHFKFNTGTISSGTSSYLFGFASHCGIYISTYGSFRFMFNPVGGGLNEKDTGLSAQSNTTYIVHISFNNTAETVTASITAEDGTVLYSDTYANTTGKLSGLLFIGMRGNASSINNYWRGTIDLNNTYIKINDQYWYRGMVPQVKTCSVVGCTGTSNLTSDDKLICTSKGWVLTTEA